MALAVFPGSFDPFHLGHLAIVDWAATTYDEVIVAVASNPEKPVAFLSQDDRVRLASLATRHLGNVRCLTVQGATGTVAHDQGADVIIRSAHKEADLERSLAVLNKFMSGGVPTQYAPSDPATEAISSTRVRGSWRLVRWMPPWNWSLQPHGTNCAASARPAGPALRLLPPRDR